MMKSKNDLRRSIVLALVLATVSGGVGFAEPTITASDGTNITGVHSFDTGLIGVAGNGVAFQMNGATLNASNNTVVIRGGSLTTSGVNTITTNGTSGNGRAFLVLDGAMLKLSGDTIIDTTATKGVAGGLAWEGICLGSSGSGATANQNNNIKTESGSTTYINSGADTAIELWAGATGNYNGSITILKESFQDANGDNVQTQAYINNMAESNFNAGSTTITINTAAGLVGYHNTDSALDGTGAFTNVKNDAAFRVNGSSNNATGILVSAANGKTSEFKAVGTGEKTVSLTGAGVTGVNVSGATASGDFAKLKVTLAGSGTGVNVQNNSKLSLLESGIDVKEGTGAIANGSTLNINKTTINNSNGVGINILAGGEVNVTDSKVTTANTADTIASGIRIDNGSKITFNGINTVDSSAATHSTSTEALLLTNSSTMENQIGTLTVKSGSECGMEIYSDSVVTNKAGATLIVEKDAGDNRGAYGVFISGTNSKYTAEAGSTTEVHLKNAAAVAEGIAASSGTATLSGTTLVDSNAAGNTGIHASDSGKILATGAGATTTVNMNGASGTGVKLDSAAEGTFDKLIVTGKGDVVGASVDAATLTATGSITTVNGDGLLVKNNGTANLKDMTIKTSDTLGKGIEAQKGTVNLEGAINITTDKAAGIVGTEAAAIVAKAGSVNTIVAGGDGISLTGNGGTTPSTTLTDTASSKFDITLKGNNNGSSGIHLVGGAAATTAGTITIKDTAGASNNKGINLEGAAGAATMTASEKVTIDLAHGGSGVVASGANATGDFKELAVAITGATDGNGINVGSGASVTLAKGDIAITGSSIQGVHVNGAASKADLTDTNITVASTSASGQGLAVGDQADAILRGTSIIDTTGATGDSHEAIVVGAYGGAAATAYGTFTAATGSDLTLKSGNDTGLEVWEGSTADLNGKLTVEKNGEGSGLSLNGIATKGSTLNLNDGSETILNLTGTNTNGSQGLYMEGATGLTATTTIDANAKLTINTATGTRSNDGIEVNGDAGAANLVDKGETNIALNAGGRGAYVHGAEGVATFTDLTVNVAGGGDGDLNNGVYVAGQGTANLTKTNINVTNFVGADGSQDAVGINMDSGVVNITGDAATPVTVKVKNGDGMILGFDAAGAGTVNLNSGKLLLDVTTDEASGGVAWHNGIENYGTLNAAAGTTLEITHNRTTGSVDPTFGKEGGIVGFTDSQTNLNGATKIMLGADNSAGIMYDKTNTTTAAEVKVGATGTMDISGSGANLVGAEANIGKFTTAAGSTTAINLTGSDAVGISALGAGAATVNGALKVVADTALKIGDGAIDINQAGDKEVQLTGNLIGDTATTGGVMNVQLDTASSFLTGEAHNANHKINLRLAKSAPWYVTGSSEVTNLENTSLIDMSHTGHDTYETITTEAYSGAGGTINMDVDLGSEANGDKLMITTSGADGGTLNFRDSSLTTGVQVTGEKVLLVVGGAGAAGTTWATPSLGSTIGNWDKDPTLEKGNDGNWYLIKVIPMDGDNPGAKTILGGMDAAYGNWRATITDDTLRKRLGDLRHTNEQEGVWARIKAGKLTSESYDGSYQMYQVGYDKKSGEDTYYGLAVDHVKNSNNLASGKSDGSLTGLSLYATNYHPSGAYSDLVLRAGKSRTSTEVVGAYPSTMEYDNWTYNASYELGKTYTKENGWFLEPELQIVYGYMKGGDYTTGGTLAGLDIHKAGTHSLVGRVGAVLGRKLKNESDYYAKINWWREFAGGGDTNMSYLSPKMQGLGLTHLTQTFASESDNRDTWLEVGIGGNVKVANKTYMYGDLLKTIGADVQKKWQVNAGIRWAF